MSQPARPPRKGLNTLRHTSAFRIINFELFARPVSLYTPLNFWLRMNVNLLWRYPEQVCNDSWGPLHVWSARIPYIPQLD